MCRCLPATQNLIGARELARMKPGAVLIQASRGGIVDEAALATSLTLRPSRRRGGRCLFDRAAGARQSAAASSPAKPHRRLLLTPHIAGVTRQASAFLFRSAWQNVERVLVQEQPPLNRVY